jgi:hypothetical protein
MPSNRLRLVPVAQLFHTQVDLAYRAHRLILQHDQPAHADDFFGVVRIGRLALRASHERVRVLLAHGFKLDQLHCAVDVLRDRCSHAKHAGIAGLVHQVAEVTVPLLSSGYP